MVALESIEIYVKIIATETEQAVVAPLEGRSLKRDGEEGLWACRDVTFLKD